MGKTRYLVKKIGDIKGKLHAKMGTIKDIKIKDLTKTEKIKKRWKEYKEELYFKKKVILTQIITMLWSLI